MLNERAAFSRETFGADRATRPAANGELEARVDFAHLALLPVSTSLADLVAADASPLHFVDFDDAGRGFGFFSNARLAEVFARLHKFRGAEACVEVVGR
jgi:hypothetical protein